MKASGKAKPEWTFLTNHAHVLLCIHSNPEIRLRDVADLVGITERAVQLIIRDLEEGRFLTTRRSGRRNIYEVRLDIPLRHPLEQHKKIGDLVRAVKLRLPSIDE